LSFTQTRGKERGQKWGGNKKGEGYLWVPYICKGYKIKPCQHIIDSKENLCIYFVI